MVDRGIRCIPRGRRDDRFAVGTDERNGNRRRAVHSVQPELITHKQTNEMETKHADWSDYADIVKNSELREIAPFVNGMAKKDRIAAVIQYLRSETGYTPHALFATMRNGVPVVDTDRGDRIVVANFLLIQDIMAAAKFFNVMATIHGEYTGEMPEGAHAGTYFRISLH